MKNKALRFLYLPEKLLQHLQLFLLLMKSLVLPLRSCEIMNALYDQIRIPVTVPDHRQKILSRHPELRTGIQAQKYRDLFPCSLRGILKKHHVTERFRCTDSNTVLHSLSHIRGLLVDARINHALHRDLKCLADFQFSGAADLQM